MLKRLVDTLTGKAVKEAAKEQDQATADVKDAAAEARAMIDAERNKAEAEERRAAKAAGGK